MLKPFLFLFVHPRKLKVVVNPVAILVIYFLIMVEMPVALGKKEPQVSAIKDLYHDTRDV